MTGVVLLGAAGYTSYAKLKSNGLTAEEISKITFELPQGQVDLAMANDEKIIEMLKKKGKIPKNATADQQQQIYNNYMKALAKNNKKYPSDMTAVQKQALSDYQKANVKNSPEVLKSSSAPTKAGSITDPWDGKTVMKDKVLVILIDFPDLPHNTLKKSDTDMYYADYSQQHYADMIFGQNGYAGPNGERLISLKQYYNQQSGGSYDVDGVVTRWYTAKNPAKYYGADSSDGSDRNVHATDLVKEALDDAVKDGIDLTQFDLKINGNEDKQGTDNIIDHLMVIHSGMGQEAGGGSIGDDAIWSHSGYIGNNIYKPAGSNVGVFRYTIEPEDGAAGVFSHEYGHDLGLPDEYDINYTGAGEPVEYWSIMSSGSWTGKVPGTEPSGFSPYDKEYFQNRYGGNWLHGTIIDASSINSTGKTLTLDQASIKGNNNGVVKVTMPQKSTPINKPTSGSKEYFSGKGNDLNNSMSTDLDLTGKTASKLTFNTWYDIEQDFDYASVQVSEDGTNWATIPGNITTTDDPYDQNPGNGITGNSKGWVSANFDLSKYDGKKIKLKFNYWSDPGVAKAGFYVDDINVTSDEGTVLSDDAEGNSKFTMSGFSVADGNYYTEQYYLIEWRNQTAADEGLAHIARGNSLMSYDPGMLIWYVDKSYDDNCTGPVANGGHPGEGFLGIVDADQSINKWSDGSIATTRYQMNDAAFSLRKGSNMFIDYSATNGKTITDNNNFMHPFFDDSKSYFSKDLPDKGLNLPKLGLKVYVTAESKDRSTATIVLKK